MTVDVLLSVVQWLGAAGALAGLLFLPALVHEARARYWRGRLAAELAKRVFEEWQQSSDPSLQQGRARQPRPSPSTSSTLGTGHAPREHRPSV